MKVLSVFLLLAFTLTSLGAMFMAGYTFYQPREIVEVKEVQTVIYRYPNTPPYEVFSDPIDFDQALVLLYGMRASHLQVLCWEFETDPGFGITDKDFQKQIIKWYDQLIDIFQRMGLATTTK